MLHLTIYETVNKKFRFVSQEPGDYVFNVYNVRTNLLVAILYADEASFRFTDKDSSLNSRELDELIETAKLIQPNYQD